MRKNCFYRSLNLMDHHQASYSNIQTPTEQNEMERLARGCVHRASADAMPRHVRSRRLAYTACIVFAVIMTSQTAVAKDLWKTVRRINTGLGFVEQSVMTDPDAYYRKIEGTLFDEDGNALTVSQMKAIEAGELQIPLYDKDGQPLAADSETDIQASRHCFSTLKKAASHLTFHLMLPEVPDGFYLTEIYTYMAPDQDKSDYLIIRYEDGKGGTIRYDARLCTPETAYSIGTDGDIQQITINNHTAVLLDGKEVMWEQDGQQLSIRTSLPTEALIEMAKSMKAIS